MYYGLFYEYSRLSFILEIRQLTLLTFQVILKDKKSVKQKNDFNIFRFVRKHCPKCMRLPLDGSTLKTEKKINKIVRVGYFCIEESFETTFNMVVERVQNPAPPDLCGTKIMPVLRGLYSTIQQVYLAYMYNQHLYCCIQIYAIVEIIYFF